MRHPKAWQSLAGQTNTRIILQVLMFDVSRMNVNMANGRYYLYPRHAMYWWAWCKQIDEQLKRKPSPPSCGLISASLSLAACLSLLRKLFCSALVPMFFSPRLVIRDWKLRSTFRPLHEKKKIDDVHLLPLRLSLSRFARFYTENIMKRNMRKEEKISLVRG